VDRKQQAHEKAQKQLNQFKDELADLREQMDLKPMEQTKNLTGAVGADSHAERSMLTSKVGAGSGGITSANSSRGFGTGAGSLTGHDTTAVTSQIARGGVWKGAQDSVQRGLVGLVLPAMQLRSSTVVGG